MNQYGSLAMRAWQENKPQEYASLENPTEFFTELGAQIADQVTTTTEQMKLAETFAEDFMTRVGQLNALRKQAEELVLSELLWSQMPTETDEGLEEGLEPTGMPADRGHRLWEMYEDDATSVEDFRAAYRTWLDEQETTSQV